MVISSNERTVRLRRARQLDGNGEHVPVLRATRFGEAVETSDNGVPVVGARRHVGRIDLKLDEHIAARAADHFDPFAREDVEPGQSVGALDVIEVSLLAAIRDGELLLRPDRRARLDLDDPALVRRRGRLIGRRGRREPPSHPAWEPRGVRNCKATAARDHSAYDLHGVVPAAPSTFLCHRHCPLEHQQLSVALGDADLEFRPFAPSVARDVTTSNSPRTSASTLPRIRKMDRLPRRRNWLAAPICTVLSCSAAASSMMIVMPTFTPVINSSSANNESEGVAAMSAVPRMTLTSPLVGLSFLRPLTTMCSMRARASVSICCADTFPGIVWTPPLQREAILPL